MKLHRIKIDIRHAKAVSCGDKTFEVRFNDRNYQKGDLIVFDINDTPYPHELSGRVFKIGCMTDFAQQEGYVVFSIKELT